MKATRDIMYLLGWQNLGSWRVLSIGRHVGTQSTFYTAGGTQAVQTERTLAPLGPVNILFETHPFCSRALISNFAQV